MKISIDIEATPQEVREFFGLPNVQPLQNIIMGQIEDNVAKGVTGFDAMTMMKPFLPAQLQTIESIQKMFLDAMTKAKPSKPAPPKKTTTDDSPR